MFGSTVSGLNADEPKLSSMLALRVEFKRTKMWDLLKNYIQANSW